MPTTAALLILAFAAGRPAPGVTELTAAPAPAPVPALKIELLPPLRDRVADNAAVGYLRAALVRPGWPRDPAEAARLAERLAAWDDTPVDQFPKDAAREFVAKYAETFRELDAAARADRCDWQQAGRLRPEDIEGVLAVVHGHRELNRFLGYRFKLELAEGRTADAVRTLQTGFRLAKNAGEGPTLIHLLVGLAILQVNIQRAEDLIRTANSPNLYWALTALPRPFIDPRPGLEGDAAFVSGCVPNLKEMQAGPVAEATANKSLDDAVRGLSRPGDAAAAEAFGTAVGRALFLAAQGPGAKKDLLSRGWTKADADAAPAAQAVILRAVARHRENWDDQVKLFYVPFPAGLGAMTAAAKRAEDRATLYRDDSFYAVLALANPALQKVYVTHARVERRLAHLRAVEAVRLHAAGTSGDPPDALADVTSVPVPEDPLTGRPFEYARDGRAFTLTAPPPADEPKGAGTGHAYAVTLRK